MDESLESLKANRIEKLNKLIALGYSPYPSNLEFKRIPIVEARKEGVDSVVSVAGRITSQRNFGALTFFDLTDTTGKIQVIIKKDTVDPKKLPVVELLDVGDFIECTGSLFNTKSGELTIQITNLNILSKALRPLPSSHFGLKDEEERYRQRYVDFAINPELKELFVKKSIFWNSIRSFLTDRGFLEVETPVLENTAGGADATPFVTHHNALDIDLFLRISMGELWQKRLMVGGFEKTFEIGRQFRNEGISREHLQDYTDMEFYWAYANYKDGMKLVEEMYKEIAQKTFGTRKFKINEMEVDLENPWKEIDYTTIIQEKFGINAQTASQKEIFAKVNSLKILSPKGATKARLLDLLWKQVRKEIAGPAFLTGHPVEISPLAKRSHKNPTTVERYQVIIAGSEMGNGYSELNDPQDQKNRFVEQQKARDAGDTEAQMYDGDFVRALEYGMPPVTGLGLSERLFAFLANKTVRECVMFPLQRPENYKIASKVKETTVFSSSTTTTITREQSLELIKSHVKSLNIIKHMFATEALMGGVYDALSKKGITDLGSSKEEWMLTGLLHDGDYCSDVPSQKQGIQISQWAKDAGYGISNNVAYAMASHNNETGVIPKSKMDWAIFCGDSLTGLIVASTLILPSKRISDLTSETILKKFKQKSFASGTRRDDIALCQEKLGLKLEEFVRIALKSMQDIANDLGL